MKIFGCPPLSGHCNGPDIASEKKTGSGFSSTSRQTTPMGQAIYRQFGKRGFDLILTTFILIFFSPLMLGVALAVRVALGRPILFRQTRPGKGRKLFTLCKFRTMRDIYDSEGNILDDSVRLTRLGRLLRKSSLDELPELFNVLAGHMSLVGPRPLLVRYLPYFRPNESKRFDVLPGLTGLAQVSGRNDLSWDERFARDVWYVDHISLGLDLRILLLTAAGVFRGGHIRAVPKATMDDLDIERGVSATMNMRHRRKQHYASSRE